MDELGRTSRKRVGDGRGAERGGKVGAAWSCGGVLKEGGSQLSSSAMVGLRLFCEAGVVIKSTAIKI
jgi:hypothetical protein